MSEESQIFIGRQPILNRDGHVVAYELLFRASASADSAVFDQQSAASLQVIVAVAIHNPETGPKRSGLEDV